LAPAFFIDAGTTTHTCLKVDNAGEQATLSSSEDASINYDGGVSPRRASLQLSWPLAYQNNENDCALTRYDLEVIASLTERP
jgi:hypothetical protein